MSVGQKRVEGRGELVFVGIRTLIFYRGNLIQACLAHTKSRTPSLWWGSSLTVEVKTLTFQRPPRKVYGAATFATKVFLNAPSVTDGQRETTIKVGGLWARQEEL